MRWQLSGLMVVVVVMVVVVLLLLLGHVLAGERQGPGRAVKEAEGSAIGVAEVERAQRSVGREVERVHGVNAEKCDSIPERAKAVQRRCRGEVGGSFCCSAGEQLHTAQQRDEWRKRK